MFETLKELRIKAGMTQKEMSERFDIPKRTIENWEEGKRKCLPYVEKLVIEKLEDIIADKEKGLVDNVTGENTI